MNQRLATLMAVSLLASVYPPEIADRAINETKEEREKRLKALDDERRRQQRNAERYAAEAKAKDDAIAAPYREARRLRNLKKMGK